MNDWKKPCEHGHCDQHPIYKAARHPDGRFIDNYVAGKCLGGSPVTAADLEGEKVWWCQAHWCSGGPPDSGCWKADAFRANAQCQMVERLLIPLPDPQPATEGT